MTKALESPWITFTIPVVLSHSPRWGQSSSRILPQDVRPRFDDSEWTAKTRDRHDTDYPLYVSGNGNSQTYGIPLCMRYDKHAEKSG